MKGMKIRASFEQEVYIDPAEAFRALKVRLGFAPRDGFVCVKDGELVYGEDVSYHGSPMYEYETISNNPKWLELYQSVECLDDYFCHSDEPQWQKEIEPDMDEDEDEDFGMRM
ncbi:MULTISPECIES: hypothetical protein [Bacillota]|jgi:aromatic ring-cleaving dioxygenase|uniref:hypothetical protein n=1 Tax=Bacillota TaxID=1239 RepID=UPI00267507FC|nr:MULTISPECIES: hypothetical protein [Bacillota]